MALRRGGGGVASAVAVAGIVAGVALACASLPPPAPVGINGCPEASKPPSSVSAALLEGHRIAGYAQIPLTDRLKEAMIALGVRRLELHVRLCLTEEGVPYCIDYTRRSGERTMDEKVIDAVRRWRYEPYRIDGKPVSVCTKIFFHYQLQPAVR